MIVINGLVGHLTFFWYVVLRLLSVHMCVSTVNVYSFSPAYQALCKPAGKNHDECDSASAWGTLRVGKRQVSVTRPDAYMCQAWDRW